MQRSSSIEALLRKAKADSAVLKSSYQASLQQQAVSEDLKVSIKNILENLRSCLDYVAQDIFESVCVSATKPKALYFPIRPTSAEFVQAIAKDFPGLQTSAKLVFDVLESIQPYNDAWLGKFNKLNNHNKHQDLVEQTRSEARQVTVSRGGGSISWTPGVTFTGGVSVLGVPIDPRTQLPIPNSVATTQVTIWVDFRFREINESVLAFVEVSIDKVERLFHSLKPLI